MLYFIYLTRYTGHSYVVGDNCKKTNENNSQLSCLFCFFYKWKLGTINYLNSPNKSYKQTGNIMKNILLKIFTQRGVEGE